ncbi:MAG: hypothetical protein P8008_01790 [Gammaproteobacteria bacterium]
MPLSVVRFIALLPLLAFIAAGLLYLRHRRRAAPGQAIGAPAYFATIVAAGILAFEVGKYLGIIAACTLPEDPGNLCGLTGWFLTGPLSAALVILAVAALWLRKGRREAGD